MGNNSFKNRLERFNDGVNQYIGTDISRLKRSALFVDFMYEYLFHGAYLQDYMQYQFYKKKASERKNFIVFGKLLEIMRICNNPSSRPLFDQKPLFNTTFKEYLGREWLSAESASEEDFLKFIGNKSQIFTKDPSGMFGQGVGLVDINEHTDKRALFQELKKCNALCEEVLVQCDETASFNASSANTMRVVTLVCADGSVKVMAAVMRIGRAGKIADNFHHDGIAALIDVDTGIIKTTGVDRNFKRYVVHPDSGVAIVGFQIPEWKAIIDTVKKAAMVVPDMRYIGWDVAVNKEHGVVLIEGNPGADPDVTQIPDQVGKWPLYLPYLKEIQNLKH